MSKIAIITRKTLHDSISLTAKFPSGAFLKFSVNRNGERLDLRFSNDADVLKQQQLKISKFLKFKPEESNEGRFDRLEKLLTGCTSGSEVINKL